MAKLKEIFKGFSKLSREQRLKALQDVGALNKEDIEYLENGGLKSTLLGEKLIDIS